MSRTHRLELDDQTLREWDAVVLESGPDGIVLDRSAFYPGGGGQPPDHGVLLWGVIGAVASELAEQPVATRVMISATPARRPRRRRLLFCP